MIGSAYPLDPWVGYVVVPIVGVVFVITSPRRRKSWIGLAVCLAIGAYSYFVLR